MKQVATKPWPVYCNWLLHKAGLLGPHFVAAVWLVPFRYHTMQSTSEFSDSAEQGGACLAHILL